MKGGYRISVTRGGTTRRVTRGWSTILGSRVCRRASRNYSRAVVLSRPTREFAAQTLTPHTVIIADVDDPQWEYVISAEVSTGDAST